MTSWPFQISGKNILLVSPKQNIIYSSAEYFKTKVFNKVLIHPEVEVVIVCGDGVSFIDITAIDVRRI